MLKEKFSDLPDSREKHTFFLFPQMGMLQIDYWNWYLMKYFELLNS
jgi:hypothetical protein